MDKLTAFLSSTSFLHLAGITAVAVLTGVGVVPVTEGFPILTGLVGLGINTSGKSTSTS